MTVAVARLSELSNAVCRYGGMELINVPSSVYGTQSEASISAMILGFMGRWGIKEL